MRNVFVIATCAAVMTAGCSSQSEGTSSSGSSGAGAPSSAEYFEIPGCQSPDTDSLRINNRGLYVECGTEKASTVHRLELGGPSPSWYAHKPGFYLRGFDPTKRDTEKTDEFSIFWFNGDKHGYFSVNSDTPASEITNPNAGVEHVEHIVVDNSPSANKWAIRKDTYWYYYRVNPIMTGGVAKFEKLIDQGPGAEYVEADESDAILWAGLGSKLSKIGIDKTVKTVDLPTKPISKIRVKAGYVWVHAGNALYRISRDTNDVKAFATIGGENQAISGGGSFAVDGNFVYLTDGRKIKVDSGEESEFFSTTINPSAGISVDSIMMQTEFKASRNLEVSSDPLDRYVYMVSTSKGARILRVSK